MTAPESVATETPEMMEKSQEVEMGKSKRNKKSESGKNITALEKSENTEKVLLTSETNELEAKPQTDIRALTTDFNLVLHTAAGHTIFLGEWVDLATIF